MQLFLLKLIFFRLFNEFIEFILGINPISIVRRPEMNVYYSIVDFDILLFEAFTETVIMLNST